MRIAFATTDGRMVNEKFCNCNQFLVYDFKEQKMVEKRYANASSDFTNEEVKDAYLAQIFDILNDCQMICAAGFSFYTLRKLRKNGITSMKTKGRIADFFPKKR